MKIPLTFKVLAEGVFGHATSKYFVGVWRLPGEVLESAHFAEVFHGGGQGIGQLLPPGCRNRTLGHLNDRARNLLVRNHHRSLTLFSAKYAHISSERLILDGNTIGIQAFTNSFEAMSGV
jgi:hypothetical protein